MSTPALPDLPILTQERIVTALLHFMSEERSIEEVAAIEGQSSSAVRNDARKPILCEAFYKVGSRNGHDIVKTTMRQRWKSLDRMAEIHATQVEEERRKRMESRSRRRSA